MKKLLLILTLLFLASCGSEKEDTNFYDEDKAKQDQKDLDEFNRNVCQYSSQTFISDDGQDIYSYSEDIDGTTIVRSTTNGETKIYLSIFNLITNDRIEQPVLFFLENGHSFKKTTKITYTVKAGDSMGGTFLHLIEFNKDEIELLSKNRILGIYILLSNHTKTFYEGDKFIKYLNCILKKDNKYIKYSKDYDFISKYLIHMKYVESITNGENYLYLNIFYGIHFIKEIKSSKIYIDFGSEYLDTYIQYHNTILITLENGVKINKKLLRPSLGLIGGLGHRDSYAELTQDEIELLSKNRITYITAYSDSIYPTYQEIDYNGHWRDVKHKKVDDSNELFEYLNFIIKIK